MKRLFSHFWLLGVLYVFSAAALYGQPPAGTTETSAQDESVTISARNSWRERRLSFGKGIYEQTCASCHDEGIEGAPAIGDRDEWSRRSPLWLAVLFEHAKEGYLGMPAKGANFLLTDQAVDAAGEYMLSSTFPEKPLD